ncbi:MAG TPA: Uma2 family endonuclease [Longimicrobium sp.]|jgi:Uma2 family endonuclease
MATQLQAITADEFLALPDDGTRRELVEGEIRDMAPAGIEHSVVAANFATELNHYVRKNKLGVVGTADPTFRLASDPDTIRVPDLAFIRRERIEQAGGVGKGFWRGAPDLAVEVVSPNDRYTEVRKKVGEYLIAGTSMVVVVDPANRFVTVHRPGRIPLELGEDGVIDGEDVVPGWKLPVRDIFI